MQAARCSVPETDINDRFTYLAPLAASKRQYLVALRGPAHGPRISIRIMQVPLSKDYIATRWELLADSIANAME